MKKKIAILLTLVMLAALSACSSGGSRDDWTTFPADTTASSAGDYHNYPQTTVPAGTAPPVQGESYLPIYENAARSTAEESMLTFSLKVDTAAYSNVARYIAAGQAPPRDAVRVEELLNYFTYDTPLSFSPEHPFAIYTEIGPSPFDSGKSLAFIRVKSREIDRTDLPPSSLIFLIDVSGSMSSYDKLPLLQEALCQLADALGEDDTVGIVTYAASASVALEPTADTQAIKKAVGRLRASGSTAGGQGLDTAYALAEDYFIEGGNNRIILATDGDFNVGPDDPAELSRLITGKRDSGIYLSVLGFGTGNLRDDIMETLSRDGNGNYAYIYSLDDAQKVLIDQMSANLFTVADDVKAQVEFNPANVLSYRLIGYENRQLSNEDFTDDSRDAGEVGAGSDMILLFEFESAAAASGYKYGGQGAAQGTDGPYADELFEVRIRYKNPGESTSRLMTAPVAGESQPGQNSSDYTFACSVAAFGHLLRDSQHASDLGLADISRMAQAGLGADAAGYRQDFLALLEQCQKIVRP